MGGERMMKLMAVAAIGVIPQVAWAASDVSNSGGSSRQATTAVAAPIASAQTASLISGAIGGAIGGGFTGGGSGGGFSPGGGSGGGFSPGGGVGGGGNSTGPGPQSSLPLTSTRGKAGGGEAAKFGIWTQGTYSHVDRQETGLEMRGNVYNAAVGADYKFTDRVLGGIAVSYESSDIDTSYNNGTFKGSGVSVAPYLGVTLDKNWTWDVSAGYGWLNYDVSRANDSITGSYNATRVFGATNVTGSFAAGSYLFQPRAGVVMSREDMDAYRESNGTEVGADHTSFGRATAGSKFGYALGNGNVPYVKLMAEWDFLRPDQVLKSGSQLSSDDKFGGVAGIGYELYSGPFTGSVEVNYNSLFREDLDLWTAALRARWEF